jgi:hypothetical protein
MINTTIDKCYVGSTCEIRSFGNDLLSIGVIEEIADDYIAIVPHNERLRLFNTSAKLKLNIFNSKAGLLVIIAEVLTSSPFQLKIVEPLKIIDHERRSGFCVAVDMWAKVSSDSRFSIFESYDVQIVYINDVSICGLHMFSEKIYEVGSMQWVMLELENRTIITQIEIIRKSEDFAMTRNGVGLYEYGIRFVGLRPEDDDRLCSFLFKRQREISSKVK